jgi:hypothetical protein
MFYCSFSQTDYIQSSLGESGWGLGGKKLQEKTSVGMSEVLLKSPLGRSLFKYQQSAFPSVCAHTI